MGRPKHLKREAVFQQELAKYENWFNRGLVRLAKMPPDIRAAIEATRARDSTFWFELLAQLEFYDAKILEHVYRTEEGATTLQQLVRSLRHVGIKREAVRRRVRMLANLGLLDLAERTKPLCINSRIELEPKVITLIRGVYKRLGVPES